MYVSPQEKKKLNVRQLNKMTDSDLIDFIYDHRTSSSVLLTRFMVNGVYIDHEKFAETFDINPVHVQYIYEVLHIATPKDILRYLRIPHHECSFGVVTLEQLIARTKGKLDKDQVNNLLWLGKCPNSIVYNAAQYARNYTKGLIPTAETPMFA